VTGELGLEDEDGGVAVSEHVVEFGRLEPGVERDGDTIGQD
jgi:hypothetical protein